MIDFTWLKGSPFDLNPSVISSWIESVIVDEGFELSSGSVIFCSDEELLEMNKKHLNHDYFTDIITFDYTEEKAVSGDLFISVDRVKENANNEGVDFSSELNRVIVHGFLHLCGYGDKSEQEANVMREKEDFYLNMLKGFT